MVDATETEALIDAIRSVVSNDELADDLRRRGHERARAMSWPASARALHDLYQKIS